MHVCFCCTQIIEMEGQLPIVLWCMHACFVRHIYILNSLVNIYHIPTNVVSACIAVSNKKAVFLT